ncbi:MAG: hypothetical protein E6Q57_13680, partial [Mycobacterium sp.]
MRPVNVCGALDIERSKFGITRNGAPALTKVQKTSMTTPQPLRNVRVLSLALNLPGPAALMR